MAPQHRRGGKHAVKDQDLTHTKYDDYNREQLLAAVKGAGCYIKDDKKSVMARKLADRDRKMQVEASRAARELQERENLRQQEIAHAAQAQQNRRSARAKRNESRSTRYERGEDVSSNSSDTASSHSRAAAHNLTVTGGFALNDSTWDSTTSESTVRSEIPPVRPAHRLQLFEWAYPHPPSSRPPFDLDDEQHPAPLPYTPLKLLTTLTHEKVSLPGKSYPEGVDPAHVPNLDAHTRTAARGGHLLNQLSRAVIEPASLWARRTTVQGWNGMLYFSLPQSDTQPINTLDEVYRSHHAAHLLLHRTPGANAAQIANLKRRRVAAVYEASLWQPVALGYLPAYLNLYPRDDISNQHKTVENLRYVRFPGCDVPHFYFWAKGDSTSGRKVRVKVKQLTSPPATSPLGRDALASVEKYLTRFGLGAALTAFRSQAVAAGRQRAWTTCFDEPLMRLCPSGAVPRAPPVDIVGVCVAEKIARVLRGEAVSPYTGLEPWTRSDGEVWDGGSVSAEGDAGEADAEEADEEVDEDEEALYRRESEDERVWTWLGCIDNVTLTHPLPSCEKTTHSNVSHPLVSTCMQNAIGRGVKRRYSGLSQWTLQSYAIKSAKRRDTVWGESAGSLAEVLERRWSVCGEWDEDEGWEADDERDM